MVDWIDRKNIFKWVEEDNEAFLVWLAYRLEVSTSDLIAEGSDLKPYIRKIIRSNFSNDDSQEVAYRRLYKDWKNHEKVLKNNNNKICKVQLEISKSARDKLKALSDADEISQSKYIEKLINYARKNPKLISKDTKVQEQYELKKRTFDDISEIKAMKEDISSIDAKVTRLLDAWEG